MPAGKAAVTEGLAWATRRNLHFGVNVRSMRRYAKKKCPALTRADLKKYRRDIRFTFRIYRIDSANSAPTATERRKALNKIKTTAQRLMNDKSWSSVDRLLTALDSPDLEVRKLAHSQLSAKGHLLLPFKKRLRNWTGLSSFPGDCLPALAELAALDVEALVPAGGLFPDPGLAKAIAALVPIWEELTGRTAGPISADICCSRKKCPFADWFSEMCARLAISQPPVGRIIDVVRWEKKSGTRHSRKHRG